MIQIIFMKKVVSISFLLFLFAKTVAQLPNYIPTDSLKACWTFSGNANDAGANQINGTINGPLLTTDRHGQANMAYQFDGGNDWINLGDIDALNPDTSDITVSAWIQTSFSNSSGARIFSKGTHGGTQPGYDLMIYPNTYGKIALIYCPGTGGFSEKQLYSNNTVNDGKWHLITGVITRSATMKLYIDGVLQTNQIDISGSSTVDIGVGTYNAAIGASYSRLGVANSPNEFFAGKIDEVAVWRRSLSACEIKSLYYESSRTSTIYPTVCELYTSPSNKYIWRSSGIYKDTLTASSGCDSIITIDLTVNQLPQVSINQTPEYVHIYSGAFNLTGNPSGGVFYGNGVTGNTFNPLIAGCGKKQLAYSYTDGNNCSNTAQVELLVYDTINSFYLDTVRISVTDTLIIDLSLTTGLSSTGMQNTIKIFPNPTKQYIYIQNSDYLKLTGYKMKIINSINQQVFMNELNQPQFVVDLSTFSDAGIYLIYITDITNKIIDVRKIIIKQ